MSGNQPGSGGGGGSYHPHQYGNMEDGELEEGSNRSSSLGSWGNQVRSRSYPYQQNRRMIESNSRYDSFPRAESRDRDLMMLHREHDVTMRRDYDSHGRPFERDEREIDPMGRMFYGRDFDRDPGLQYKGQFMPRSNTFSGPIDFEREQSRLGSPFSRLPVDFPRARDGGWVDPGAVGYRRGASFDRDSSWSSERHRSEREEYPLRREAHLSRPLEMSATRLSEQRVGDMRAYEVEGRAVESDESTRRAPHPITHRDIAITREVPSIKREPVQTDERRLSPESDPEVLNSSTSIDVVKKGVRRSRFHDSSEPLLMHEIATTQVEISSVVSADCLQVPSGDGTGAYVESTNESVVADIPVIELAAIDVTSVVSISLEPKPESLSAAIPAVIADTIVSVEPVLPPADLYFSTINTSSGGSRRKGRAWGQGVLSRAAAIDIQSKSTSFEEESPVVREKKLPAALMKTEATVADVVEAAPKSESTVEPEISAVSSHSDIVETVIKLDNIINKIEESTTKFNEDCAALPISHEEVKSRLQEEVEESFKIKTEQEELSLVHAGMNATVHTPFHDSDSILETLPSEILVVPAESSAGSVDLMPTEIAQEGDPPRKRQNNPKRPTGTGLLSVATTDVSTVTTAQSVVSIAHTTDEIEEQPKKKRGRPVMFPKPVIVSEKLPIAAITVLAEDKPVPPTKFSGFERAPVVAGGRSRPRGGLGPNMGAGRGRGRRPNPIGGNRDTPVPTVPPTAQQTPVPQLLPPSPPPQMISSKEQRKLRDRVLLPKVFGSQKDLIKAFTAIRYMVNITQGGSMAMHKIMKVEDAPSQKLVGKLPMPLTAEIAVCLDIVEAKSAYIWRQLTELKREERVIHSFCSSDDNISDTPVQTDREVVNEIAHELINKVLEMNNEEIAKPQVAVARKNQMKWTLSTDVLDIIYEQNVARIEESSITLSVIDLASRDPTSIMDFDSIVTRNRIKMVKNRDAITAEIRRRKLNTRRAWEVLGDHYLQHQSKHKSLHDDIETEEEESRFRSRSMGISSRFSSRIGASSGFGRSETSRGDFDTDRLVQQILLRETMETRIENGKVTIPDMDSPWQDPNNERPLLTDHSGELPSLIRQVPDIIDISGSRLTTDGKRQICASSSLSDPCPRGCNCARQVDSDSRKERVWTDIEKCIFIDKFMQYPKNFPKISSFLTNRDTKDCVKFYYESKAKIQFKSLLREFDNRRRNQKNSWNFSISAAESVGVSIFLNEDSIDRDAFVELPADDASFHSYLQHPPYMQKLFKNFYEDDNVTPLTTKSYYEKKLRPIPARKEPAEAEYIRSISPCSFNHQNQRDLTSSTAARSKTSGGRGRGRGRGRWSRPQREKESAAEIDELKDELENDKETSDVDIDEKDADDELASDTGVDPPADNRVLLHKNDADVVEQSRTDIKQSYEHLASKRTVPEYSVFDEDISRPSFSTESNSLVVVYDVVTSNIANSDGKEEEDEIADEEMRIEETVINTASLVESADDIDDLELLESALAYSICAEDPTNDCKLTVGEEQKHEQEIRKRIRSPMESTLAPKRSKVIVEETEPDVFSVDTSGVMDGFVVSTSTDNVVPCIKQMRKSPENFECYDYHEDGHDDK